MENSPSLLKKWNTLPYPFSHPLTTPAYYSHSHTNTHTHTASVHLLNYRLGGRPPLDYNQYS